MKYEDIGMFIHNVEGMLVNIKNCHRKGNLKRVVQTVSHLIEYLVGYQLEAMKRLWIELYDKYKFVGVGDDKEKLESIAKAYKEKIPFFLLKEKED